MFPQILVKKRLRLVKLATFYSHAGLYATFKRCFSK